MDLLLIIACGFQVMKDFVIIDCDRLPLLPFMINKNVFFFLKFFCFKQMFFLSGKKNVFFFQAKMTKLSIGMITVVCFLD